MERADDRLLSDAELLELQRWNTPAVYDGREQSKCSGLSTQHVKGSPRIDEQSMVNSL